MKKLTFFLIFLFLMPIVLANSNEPDCSLTNFVECFPLKFLEFLVSVFNTPISLLLTQIKNYLTSTVNLESFKGLYQIIVYVLSIFYGLFLILAGYAFITSGNDIIKRETAKQWLKSSIFMILFVQASYWIYSIALDLSSKLSSGVLSLINPNFFLLTFSSLNSIGLELSFSLLYVITLIITILILLIRYFLVIFGLALFPIGLFLYFIPPIRGYGKLIIETLMLVILLPFFFSLIILIGAKLVELNFAGDFNILIMISVFSLINLSMIVLIFFAVVRSASYFNNVGGSITSLIKYFAV